MNEENPAAIQNVILQRDDLQNGLLSTCREVSRATAVRKCHYFSLVKLPGVLSDVSYCRGVCVVFFLTTCLQMPICLDLPNL